MGEALRGIVVSARTMSEGLEALKRNLAQERTKNSMNAGV